MYTLERQLKNKSSFKANKEENKDQPTQEENKEKFKKKLILDKKRIDCLYQTYYERILEYKADVVNDYLNLESQQMKNPNYKQEIFKANDCSILKIYNKMKQYTYKFSKRGEVFNANFTKAENQNGKLL